jgi:ADP-heptose:LPS heptosyltransferase
VTIAGAGIRRLALVRLDRIGDFLLWLSTARFYRHHFHDAEIVLFGNENWADLAISMPYRNYLVPVQVSDQTNSFRIRGRPPFDEFDAVVCLQYSRTALHDRFVARLNSSRKVAANERGPNLTDAEFIKRDKIYTDLLELDPTPKHELVRDFELLDAITGEAHTAVMESLAPFLKPVGHELPDHYVAIFPGSSWTKKNLPWPRTVAICRMVKQRFGLRSVLCGTTEDKIVAANIARNAPDAVVDLTGALDLPQSLSVMAGARLVIANDLMASHAANFVGRPSVCVLGGGYNAPPSPGAPRVGRFFPYPDTLVSPRTQVVLEHPMPCQGCGYRCKYDAVARDCIPCVDYIPLTSLLDAVDNALSASDS